MHSHRVFKKQTRYETVTVDFLESLIRWWIWKTRNCKRCPRYGYKNKLIGNAADQIIEKFKEDYSSTDHLNEHFLSEFTKKKQSDNYFIIHDGSSDSRYLVILRQNRHSKLIVIPELLKNKSIVIQYLDCHQIVVNICFGIRPYRSLK